ncbi:MAG: DNA repair exonuclease [Fimbriimonadales bacterium]|nr:DNA repair exonuclease [Fimbriimonadales bacterium]MDW8051487.1 DNA repair exonuclease [Armatimonadota bacterium]
MLRLAHTADVHLGRAFGYLGAAASEHQARLKRAFERVFELARQHECHAVLIAGDLFDSPRISRAWLEFALATIAGARLPTVVIPGNHDPAERSPLREVSLPSNLHYLPATQRLTLAHLELEIVACPAGDEARWQAFLHRDPNGASLQVGLMHGSMPSAGGQGTIAPEWIAQSNLDYVALGDWHSPQEWTQGRTVCWYSGAPEMILPSQRLPAVMVLVELRPQHPAQVRLLTTGEARPAAGAHEGVLVWDISRYESLQELRADLQAQLMPETVATIRLVGQWRAPEPLDVALLTEQLQRHCLWLEVETAHQVEPLTPHTPFEQLLLQVAEEAIARTPEQAPLYHEATQTALYLLRGGRL